MYERERLNKLGKSDASIVRILWKKGRKGKRAGKKGRGKEPSLTTSHIRRGYIERTEVAGAVFGAEQLVAFQLKEMFTTKALLVKLKIKMKKRMKKKRNAVIPATCRDLIRSLVEV